MPRAVFDPLCARWRQWLTALAFFAGSSTAAAQAQELKVGGTGAALGTMQLLVQAYAKADPDARITVLPSMGSGGGIKALLGGAIQIGLRGCEFFGCRH